MINALIATLAVHPDARGRGITQRLVFTAQEKTIRKGARTAMLEVRAGNHAAQALYRWLGFEVVNRRLRYYRDNGEDALLMTAAGLDETCLLQLRQKMTRKTERIEAGL